jgi:hypothetical protein
MDVLFKYVNRRLEITAFFLVFTSITVDQLCAYLIYARVSYHVTLTILD